jgi:A/G-specific adenine glycosylase
VHEICIKQPIYSLGVIRCFPIIIMIYWIKGGEYTAAAIASFLIMKCSCCWRKCVSGFVSLFWCEIAQASPKELLLWLSNWCQRQPATFNQAIMEFGALQCVPKSQIAVLFLTSCAALQRK